MLVWAAEYGGGVPRFDSITRDHVLAALAEYDDLGRDDFLSRYGFKEARDYFLLREGRAYDSKAIVGVAHGIATGEYLRSGDFTGGASVAETLRRLGFHVTGATDWTWSELVLAGALLVDNGWQRTLRAHEDQVISLSRLLRDREPELSLSPTFRSANSVQRKLEDIRTIHPDYAGVPTRGGKLTAQVAQAFLDDPQRMMAVAETLRSLPELGAEDDRSSASAVIDDPTESVVAAVEGRIARRFVVTRERDRTLRKQKLQSVQNAGLPIACEVCGFNFGDVYGDHGSGYIQVHHALPLHVSGEVTTTLDDLVLLCANCHVMIHHGSSWKSPAELKQLVGRRRDG